MSVHTSKKPTDGGQRKAGRPKDDELVTRPVTVHNLNNKVLPHNKQAYVHETISNAKKIYTKYGKTYPNPLNVNEKDLTEDARDTWKYIFSTRGYTENDCVEAERVFHNAGEIVFAFECFANYLIKNNFIKEFIRPDGEVGMMPIAPTELNFARWLGIGVTTYMQVLNKDEAAKERFGRIASSLYQQGAIAGVYKETTSIFSLKNVCGWADKPEDRAAKKEDTLGLEEAKEIMDKIGYSRPKLEEIKALPDG